MNKSKQYIYPIIGSILLIIGLVLGLFLGDKQQEITFKTSNKYANKMADIFNVIEKEYVDTVEQENLFKESITRLLHHLDPHSNYITAEDLKEMTEGIHGEYGGVGIRFTIYDDTLDVVNVIENSPSAKVGIQKFDQIIQVDTMQIANVGLKNKQVRELLKGEPGTPVKVKILRNGEILDKTIIRDIVPIETVSASYMISDDIGYIRLSQFSMPSAQEFYMAALNLKRQGMKKLIFDLRYNGGGVLGSAVSIIEAFLDKGTPIVSTKGKNSPERVIKSENNPMFGDIELAVLINTSSASASEILAGAIQDNDRGVIIGRRSFGKGLVQQDFSLKDGSDLRLTVSRYYTPTGRLIQKPYNDDYEDYIMDEINRYESGELYQADSSLFIDSLKYTTPGGKTVYGGGGIMPDVFVPLDTTGNSSYFRKLQIHNTFNDFSYHYVRLNGMDSYTDLKDFNQRFVVDNVLLKKFTDYAEERYKIKKDEGGFQHSLRLIKRNIKAEIARQKWLETGVFYILNQDDTDVERAIQELRK